MGKSVEVLNPEEVLYSSKEELKSGTSLVYPKSFEVFGFTYNSKMHVAVETIECEVMKPVSFREVFDYHNITISASEPIQTKLYANNIAMVSALSENADAVWDGNEHFINLLACDGTKYRSYSATRCSSVTLFYDNKKDEIIFQCHPRVTECKLLQPLSKNFTDAEFLAIVLAHESIGCKKEATLMAHLRHDEHALLLMNETIEELSDAF